MKRFCPWAIALIALGVLLLPIGAFADTINLSGGSGSSSTSVHNGPVVITASGGFNRVYSGSSYMGVSGGPSNYIDLNEALIFTFDYPVVASSINVYLKGFNTGWPDTGEKVNVYLEFL